MSAAPEAADLLAQVTRRVQDALERHARAAGVSPTLARLLEVLSDRAPTINELGESLGLDKSSTSGLVGRAQRRGLVRRIPSQIDRRSVRVRLTPVGRELLRNVEAAFARDLNAMLEPLHPDELEGFAESLLQILAAQTHR